MNGSRTLPTLRARSRTDWLVVDDLAEAVDVAGRHGDRLVLDLENTLVGYDSTEADRLGAMEAAMETVAAHGGLRLLAFISNAPFALPRLDHDRLTVRTVSAARKPYVRLSPLRQIRSDLTGAAVYGDQPLTDGRLARNLGGIWLQPRHAHEPRAHGDEPWWPRLMRRAGRRALRRHFHLGRLR